MAILWPGKTESKIGESIVADTEGATVERVQEFPCRSLRASICGKVTVRLESGPDEGRQTSFRSVSVGSTRR